MLLAPLRRSASYWLLTASALVGIMFSGRAIAQESFLVTTDDGSFSVFDLATYTLQKTMTAGYYDHSIIVGLNPRLAFLSADAAPMSVVDLTIGREIKKIPNVWGESATLTDDGKSVLIWDDENSTLDIIDVASLTVTKRVNLYPAMGAQANDGGTVVQVGNKAFLAPIYFSYSPNNKYVAGVVDLTTYQVTAIPLALGSNPYFEGWTNNAAATPDGKHVAMVLDAYQQGQDTPLLALIDTSTYQVTSQPLMLVPDAIVMTPNKSDPTKYFGYITGEEENYYTDVAAVVDFRPGSPTYGQVLPSTIVELTNLYRDINGSGLAINSDGSKLVVSGDGQQQYGPNLLVVDTGKMFTDPTHAIIDSQIIVGGASTFGLGIGTVDLMSPNSAPTVTSVQGDVTNDKATEITVLGTNFMDGALVRIGGIPPLPANVDNATTLRVTVPVNAPSDPGLDIIVTNPDTNDPLDQQYQSGLLAGALNIKLNPAFQPAEQFASLKLAGYGLMPRIFDLQQRVMTTLPGFGFSLDGIEFASDGADLFGAGYGALAAWNTATSQMRGNILGVPGGLSIRQPLAPSIDPLSGKPVVYAPTDSSSQPYDLLLDVVDANPQSQTFNTVLRQIPAGLSYQSRVSIVWSVASRPDGKYVYAYFYHSDVNGINHLAIYDTAHNTAVVVDMDRFNLPSSELQITISPDGKWLVMQGYSSPIEKPQLKVFDIGTKPNNPRLVGVITPPHIGGTYPFYMSSYVVAGSHLFALGNAYAIIVAFNFNPANNDYRPTAIYNLPADGDYVYSPLVPSPDGKYIYVAIDEHSLIAVLDPDKLAHGMDPLVTTIADSDNTRYLAVSPVPPPSKASARVQPSR